MSALLCALLSVSYAGELSLTLPISQVEARPGKLVVALYENEDQWLEPSKAARLQTLPVTPGALEVTLSSLESGRYAVVVFHDENENGRVDMRWIPFPGPAEGFGLSMGSQSGFSLPSFDKASFELSRSQAQPITLTY